VEIPQTPPGFLELSQEIISAGHEKFLAVLAARVPPDPNGNYHHWDKLRHLKTPPGNFSHRQWWFAIKTARRSLYQILPHTAKDGTPFVFAEPNVARRLLHEVDIHGGGGLKSNAQVANPNTRDAYLINSLIEEAITSSQLEGAATTRKVAKEMLRQKRKPKNRSEKMIVNNYRAMQYINEIADEDLTPNLILELQRILTVDTLENPDAVARFRTTDDIYVSDQRDSTVIYVPPDAIELPARLESICKFANASDTKMFLHPVIRAIVLHFLLAYDHPFRDGNGRTARALFYWSMLRQGYWAMKFVSISRILKSAPAQYTRSYLYTETDDNDVTYFILHQLTIIQRAIDELFDYLKRKSDEIKDLEVLVRKSAKLQSALNHRQLAILNRAAKNSDAVFTIASHRGAHNVTYDTARTDLLKLNELGLLEKRKSSRAFIFVAANDLQQQLKNF